MKTPEEGMQGEHTTDASAQGQGKKRSNRDAIKDVRIGMQSMPAPSRIPKHGCSQSSTRPLLQ
jgi:hypothetical protein